MLLGYHLRWSCCHSMPSTLCCSLTNRGTENSSATVFK